MNLGIHCRVIFYRLNSCYSVYLWDWFLFSFHINLLVAIFVPTSLECATLSICPVIEFPPKSWYLLYQYLRPRSCDQNCWCGLNHLAHFVLFTNPRHCCSLCLLAISCFLVDGFRSSLYSWDHRGILGGPYCCHIIYLLTIWELSTIILNHLFILTF